MKVRILWLIAFLLFTVQLSAQQKVTVKGKITDEHNEPVIGANIMEKGTTNGVISDFDGFFTLNVSSGATLVVSYICLLYIYRICSARNSCQRQTRFCDSSGRRFRNVE